MSANVPTRYTKGVTTYTPQDPMASYPLPSRTYVYNKCHDFSTWIAAEWALSGTGTPTRAISTTAPFANGVVAFATSAAANDSNVIQTDSNGFIAEPTHQMWFDIDVQVDDATNSQIFVGFCGTTTPFTGTPAGIYITKAAASTAVVATVCNGTNSVTATFQASSGGNYAMLASTMYRLTAYYDGGRSGNVTFTLNPYPGTLPNNTPTTAPLVVQVATTYLPANTTGMYGTMALLAGTAAARTMYVDRVLWACERN